MIYLVTADLEGAAFKSQGSGKSKSDFALRIWRGEQWTVYFSWSKKFEIIEP